MATEKHPLIGKIIRFDTTPDHEYYNTSRFIADLGDGLMLACRVSPHTGADLDDKHIISLHAMADPEVWAGIYDDWDTLSRDMESPNEAKKVIRLVPKEAK
jgi:hypothetical protein